MGSRIWVNRTGSPLTIQGGNWTSKRVICPPVLARGFVTRRDQDSGVTTDMESRFLHSLPVAPLVTFLDRLGSIQHVYAAAGLAPGKHQASALARSEGEVWSWRRRLRGASVC